MADDIDVPPLEDLSGVLQKVLHSKSIKTDGSFNRGPVTTSSDSCTVNERISVSVPADTENREEVAKPSQDKNSTGFGGMKKGFLFSSSSKTSSASDHKAENESIPFITAKKDSSKSQHRFDDVQQAMHVSDAFAMNKEWLTEDLLMRIQSSGKLCQQLQDPIFVQAIAEFQANPHAAMQKYGDSADMQEFFCQFCAILGEHFSSIGDKQVPTSEANSTTSSVNEVLVRPREETAEISVSNSCQVNRQAEQGTMDADLEDSKVKEILSDSKIRETLLDCKIQQLMTYLRSDPDKAHMLLQNADGDLKAKINCLIGAGLLQFQSSA